MIIGSNFVWIHVPKTAGSSFEQMMEKRHGLPVYGEQHDTARDIPAEHRGKTIIGFMRDPLNAEVSNWRYHNFSWENNGTFTFERWCQWRYEEDERWGYFMGLNQKDVVYGHKFNVRQQAGYLCNEEGHSIADHIFRFDELESSLAKVQEITGLDCDLSEFFGMSYGWGRGKEDYSKHVTPKAEAILRKAKPLDFRLWETEGKIPTDFFCETVPHYAYSR